MDHHTKMWDEVDESFVIDLLEKTFRRLDYSIANFHRTERVHEDGVDLLCEKDSEKIALQVKMRPVKGDIEQFNRFAKNASGKKPIYVYIKNPTKPFKSFLEREGSKVELWDSVKLHSFLVENECVEYICLYFSMHPIVRSLLQVHKSILERRNTYFSKHRLTKEEIAKLWVAKDNSVKVWVPLYFTYLKWNKTLMAKTEKDKKEFHQVLESISKDLDMVYNLCGEKLVSSIEDLAKRHPDLIGLLWNLVSQRTNWITYTTFIDHKAVSFDDALFYTAYYWICPVFNESKKVNMSGFYSTLNYLLDNFNDVAKGVECALDWVFEEMAEVEI